MLAWWCYKVTAGCNSVYVLIWGACIQGREVDDSDVFHYNSGFTHQLFRIKINSIQLKETVEENKKTNDQVLQDRQYQVRPDNVRHVFCCGSGHALLDAFLSVVVFLNSGNSLPSLPSHTEYAPLSLSFVPITCPSPFLWRRCCASTTAAMLKICCHAQTLLCDLTSKPVLYASI